MLLRHLSVRSLTWVVASLVVGTGCDRVFELEELADAGALDSDSGGETVDAPRAVVCLADDFSSPEINQNAWTIQDSSAATVAPASGQLVFSLAQADNVHYAQILTAVRDMTNDAFSVEVITPINAATNAEVGIALQSDSAHRYQLFITNSSLLMRITTPDGNSDTFVPYSTATHRFIRLHHATNMMLWETSADGNSWTARRQASAEVDVTNVNAHVFAGTYQREPEAPGKPVVDNALIECLQK